jgi:hypothetical protein
MEGSRACFSVRTRESEPLIDEIWPTGVQVPAIDFCAISGVTPGRLKPSLALAPDFLSR